MPTRPVPAEALARARAQHAALVLPGEVNTGKTPVRRATTPLNAAWTAVGPVQVQTSAYGLVTGRVTAVAFDPSETSGNTVLVGTTGGGVWKSTNAAAAASAVSFAPLTDGLAAFSANAGTGAVPSLSIGALTVQPGGTGVVLAGTGDTNDASDSYYGGGLLRSADHGSTWTLVTGGGGASFVGEGFAAFAWSTVSPQVVVAAVSSSAESAVVGRSRSPGVRGLWVSQDAGSTWTVATIQDGSTTVQSQYTDFSSFRGNAATAVVWNPVRKRFYAAVRSHGYYESVDGSTWTRLSAQPGTWLTAANCPARAGNYGLAGCPVFRGALAVQPVSGDLFALTVDAANNDQGLWQDVCSVSNGNCAASTVQWSNRLDATPMETAGRILSGDYNLSLAAVPAATAVAVNDTLLFAGATDLFRCGLYGGCSLRNTTNTGNGCAAPAGVAPAQHAIDWQVDAADTSAPRLMLGNDGGLWRSLDGVRQQAAVCSTDDRTHFDNLNGALGSLAEIAGFSSHPTDGNVLLAALGGNGSAASTTATQASAGSPWAQLSSGESGTVAIDQGNGTTWLLQSGEGVNLHTCTRGSKCTAADFTGPASIGSAQVGGDAALVDAPALLDPVLNTNVIAGTCRVFRGPASGGSTWSTSSAISRFLAGPSGTACTNGDAFIRSLAAGGGAVIVSGSQNSGSPVLYAGLAGVADGGSSFGGRIFVNTTASTASSSSTWTDITGSTVTNGGGTAFNASGFDVSGVATDPSDSTGRTVYATVMGFGSPHVYRSTDAGSTWLNITANLPDAPANAVVVDPGNPRTVYVAMDTGVYVAQDVTTCVNAATNATANCWGVYGTALPGAPVTSLMASPAVAGGTLRAGTYGRGIWQIPLLSAGQALLPAATFAPASLSFTDGVVGSTGTAKTATLTNTGNAVLQIGTLSASAGFLETDTCAGTSLTVGGSCTIKVSFSPAAAGTTSGSVDVHGNLSGGYASLPLAGTALGTPDLLLSPSTLTLGAVAVGSTSVPGVVTVRNTGTGPADVSYRTSADFSISGNTCGATVAPGASCTVSVTFTPSQSTPEFGSLTLTDAAGDHTVGLNGTGTGTSSISLSPASIRFEPMTVNGYMQGAFITVTNSGNATAQLQEPTITGGFVISRNDCGSILAAGSSCSIRVYFSAPAAGLQTGVFTLSDANASHTVLLSGTGQATTVVFSPVSLAFGTVAVGSTSATQRVTVTNGGDVTIVWGTLAVDGDFRLGDNSCVGRLLPQAGCSFSVSFVPTLDGARTGSVTLPDQFASHAVLLTGTGHGTASVQLSPAADNFGTVAVGASSSVHTFVLTNSGSATATLPSSTVSGDFLLTGSTCLATLAPAADCALTVAFLPQATGTRMGTLTAGGSSAALSGNAVGAAVLSPTPTQLGFGPTTVGSTSAAQTITVRNSGTASATLAPASVTGDFTLQASTCGTSLAPSATCTVSVVFVPRATGTRTGVLTVAGLSVALGGSASGIALVQLSPLSLSFGSTPVNTTSAAQTLTLANVGSASAPLNAPVITGDFLLTGSTCTDTLPVSATCSLTIVFAPGAVGMRTGLLVAGTQVAALSGNGAGSSLVTLSPAVLTFPSTVVGSTSAALAVRVSNSGTSAAALGAAGLTGDFALGSSTCGTILAAGASCTQQLTFSPSAPGIRTGLLSLADASGNHTVSLSGTGILGTLSLTPSSLTFEDTAISASSGAKVVTLLNSGTAPLTLSNVALTGDFSMTGSCSGTVLAAGQSCVVSVTFRPAAAGARIGTVTVTSNGGGSSTVSTVALSGNGTAGLTIVLTPASLDFGTQLTGTQSAVRNITISNTGTAAGALGSIRTTGDFALGANTCGASLPVQTGCTVSITFTPTVSGTRNGTLAVMDDAGTQTAPLTGIGTAAATDTLSPLSLSFPAQQVGTVSGVQTVTLSNTGDTALTLVSAQVLSGDFTANNGCGPTLPAHSSCAIGVAFVPKSVGSQTGTLQVTDVQRNQTVTLSGTGTAGPGVSLSPSGLLFARTGVGVSTAGQTLTLSNNGGVPLQVSAVTVIGDFGVVAGSNTCSLTVPLAVGSSCSLQIAFLPSGAGQRTGSVNVTSNAATQVSQLSGTGVDFQFTANGDTTVTTANGGNAVFPLLLRPLIATDDPVTLTCTGAPANARCTITSQYGDLSATQTVSLTILTGTTSGSARLQLLLLPWLAGLPWCIRGRTRRRAVPVLAALALLCAAALCAAGGCGSGRTMALAGGGGTTTGGGTAGPVTPAGTYTITATATAAGVSHSAPLTLVVR